MTIFQKIKNLFRKDEVEMTKKVNWKKVVGIGGAIAATIAGALALGWKARNDDEDEFVQDFEGYNDEDYEEDFDEEETEENDQE